MNKANLSQSVLLALVLSCLISSCARIKTAPRRKLSKTDALTILQDHNIDFEWWACKGKVSLKSAAIGGSGKMYLRIKKDSVVWSVVKKASIEVARMNATTDEVMIKYPTEKSFQRGNVDQLSKTFGVDLSYEDVQQLIVGNVFLPDTTNSTLTRLDNGYLLSWSDNYGYDIGYILDDRMSTLKTVTITDPKGRSIKQSFDDYRPTSIPIINAAYSRKIEIDEETQVVLRLTEVEVNVPKKTPFSISSRYTEIPFEM